MTSPLRTERTLLQYYNQSTCKSKKKSKAHELADKEIRKGCAADVNEQFAIKPGDKVVLLARVSSHEQGKAGNLVGQETHLPQAVEAAGGVVVDVVSVEWSGRGREWWDHLWAAAEVARKHGAILLAATTDRLIRHSLYRSDHPDKCRMQATEDDLRELAAATRGVRVMTFLHPDATPEECRSLLIRWGRDVKGNKGGRPPKEDRGPGWKKRRRERLRPQVLAMKGTMSMGEIAEALGVHKGTIQTWLARMDFS